MPEPRLAVQLYALRNAGLGFEAMLRVASDAGYDGVETVGSHGLEAAAMRDALGAAGLVACSSHVGMAELEAGVGAVADFQAAVGNDTIVVPWLPEPRRPATVTGWIALGRRLAELATELRTHGLNLGYHNHDFEMAPLDGRSGLEWLLEGAGDGIELELDLGWVARTGRDPLALFERLADRIRRVHLKDLAASAAGGGPEHDLPEGGWADVGHGTLEWPRLLPRLRRSGVGWLIVEHDEPRDPVASVGRSAAYLRSH